ncbi:MAG: hypothetical protein UY74_C0035G0010 [Candidatus Kaiserbacteria bacterium GW2011_GWC2_52_8b]|uniref:Uncharacterized protein n=2 Tax=Candidatus Kaiseribacteriota TaxID=1752734 RepID=A0A0G1XI77_9BACT|nr:MAG: hypothetical protein UY67_C0018G0009 [Candidatus Kaiserbacteria bacterium GW2011_GWA2_52_12]KKW30641.1 MAG: hypothetical protein UY74_C0035G0010 [Candidatus Kaiserbacteria bacterium GW2011_GWC2_52_8b]
MFPSPGIRRGSPIFKGVPHGSAVYFTNELSKRCTDHFAQHPAWVEQRQFYAFFLYGGEKNDRQPRPHHKAHTELSGRRSLAAGSGPDITPHEKDRSALVHSGPYRPPIFRLWRFKRVEASWQTALLRRVRHYFALPDDRHREREIRALLSNATQRVPLSYHFDTCLPAGRTPSRADRGIRTFRII